jgi:glutathione S-transferase
MTMAHYRLVSFELCPFVQRSVATLREKGVDFDIEYIDLGNKPDWFLELSPTGKVPTLEVTDDEGEKTVLFESVVINEYLDEVTEGRMMPTDPLAKARARAWIEFANGLLPLVFELTGAMDEAQLAKVEEKLNPKLDKLEEELGEGPFFLGSDISLVDTAFLPALQRLGWFNEAYPELKSFDGRPKLARWLEALSAKESVKRSAVADLREKLEKMLGRDRGGGERSLIGARLAKD